MNILPRAAAIPFAFAAIILFVLILTLQFLYLVKDYIV